MSIVDEQVESYIAFKQGLGIQMISEASALRHLKRYADSLGHTGYITLELVVSWARSGKNLHEGYEIRRYEMARRVSDYAAVFDDLVPRLPAGLLGKAHSRIDPYIYTDEEVSLLMKAASRSYSMQDPLRSVAFEVLIGILRTTGMRPFEALSLKDGDFDQENLVLMVRKAKNNKERMVPIDDSVAAALATYQERRDELRSKKVCDNLIITDGDKPLALHSFQNAFCELRCILLERGEVWERRPPRPYDLRHTFVVRTLLRWYEQKEDINVLLPVLATYIGHSSISETYWYLTGTPELMEVAVTAFEDLAKAGDSSWNTTVSKAW
jgi:integrase